MKIAVTGTPGTGKTVVANLLAKSLNFKYIDLNALLLKGFKTFYDEDLETWEVDIDEAAKKLTFCDACVIDGHLSHEFEVDTIIILRCDPVELAMRLAKRSWKQNKIEENVDAEGLNVISDEVHHLSGKKKHIIEVDTTTNTPEKTVQEILEYISKPEKRSPHIDFIEKLPVNLKDI